MSEGAAQTHNTFDVQPIPFLFEGNNLIRCLMILGVPWFVVVDICRVLCVKQPTQAVEWLDKDEKAVFPLHTLGGIQDHLIVSESGLYTMILRSKAAVTSGTSAHKFRRWVTSDLLPTIRKTGRYQSGSAQFDKRADESDSAKLAKVAEARLTYGTRASAKLWLALGLPTVPEMFHDPAQIEIDYSPPSAATAVN